MWLTEQGGVGHPELIQELLGAGLTPESSQAALLDLLDMFRALEQPHAFVLRVTGTTEKAISSRVTRDRCYD
jgi:hypothetical protein